MKHATHSSTRRQAAAFTMIEMMVVVAIIAVLLTVVLPAANTLWSERKSAQAENLLQGMLMTARAKAIRTGAEAGFLAIVDRNGNQRLLSIQKVPAPSVSIAYPEGLPGGLTYFDLQLLFQDLFEIDGDRNELMPAPLRVAPRAVLDAPDTGNPATRFSDDELIYNDLEGWPDPATPEPGQRHRNIFSVIFTPDGRLEVNRNVLVLDADENDDGVGDSAGAELRAAQDAYVSLADYTEFYALSGAGKVDLHPTDAGSNKLAGDDLPEGRHPIIADAETPDYALQNFPSVDGLVVYDDREFQDIDEINAARTYLERSAQPIYVSPLTGAIVKGRREGFTP